MKHWNAVVLAGDRGTNDPVAKIAQVSCKAETCVGGKILLEHVVSALADSQSINKIYSVGPDESSVSNGLLINALFEQYKVTRLPVESGPSLSALQGVQTSAHYPTLILTCDLPLLNADLVDYYCQHMSNVSADFAIGAVNYHSIIDQLHALKKTKYQFGQRSVCFANLFAVLSQSGMRAIEFWHGVEGSRKKPIEVIRKIGGLSVLQYKMGILSLEQAAKQLSRKTGTRVVIEDVLHPGLAIDVDTADDYKILQAYLKQDS